MSVLVNKGVICQHDLDGALTNTTTGLETFHVSEVGIQNVTFGSFWRGHIIYGEVRRGPGLVTI